MNDRDIITRGIHTDCLLNYETVKYFGGEQHEGERYRVALRDYQALEYKVIGKQASAQIFLNSTHILSKSLSTC
jgi:ABC-type transport system involved in Fe-S cluster assembly fused permease/ATPase subunit